MCALVTGVQTCALPISDVAGHHNVMAVGVKSRQLRVVDVQVMRNGEISQRLEGGILFNGDNAVRRTQSGVGIEGQRAAFDIDAVLAVQIGRASCRVSLCKYVYISVFALSL